MNKDNQDRRSLTMAEIMRPNAVNFRGNVHGGYLLQLLDQVAYTCAARYAGKHTLTLSVDQVFFKQPIHVGELVTFHASVNYVGNTSMEIGIRVTAENLFTREERHTTTCYFTMVAIDDKGHPTKIPPLAINDEIQERRFNEALVRREARMQVYKMQTKT